MRRAGVIGGGAWGTALAQVCARAGLEVVLWAREPAVVDAIDADHENPVFLPGVTLDGAIRASLDPADLAASDLVLAVAPAQHLRSSLTAFAPHARAGQPILLCSKGVERGSLKLMTQVLAEVLPDAAPAVLSGPSFAGEVARGLPTAITLAARDMALAHELAQTIATPTFRPYVSDDMIGAEGRRGGEERPRHRLRHRRGPGAGPQRPRRPDHPGLRRTDAGWPCGPRR